jgi:hypothetical protein
VRYRFCVVVILVASALAGCSSAEPGAAATARGFAATTTTMAPDPATTRAVTTTTQQPTAAIDELLLAQRVETIEAMVEARNSGDFDAWRAFFPSQRPIIWASTVRDEAELEWQRSYMAANETWTITGPCRSQADRIQCPMTLVNDFFGPAGLFFRVPVNFRFNEAGEISYLGADTWAIAGDPGDYSEAFDTWLAEAHPDVDTAFGPRVEGEDQLPGAADMPVALEYVHEFLAQSGDYPLAAVSVAEGFFDAYNAADDDAAVALLSPDVEASDTWGPIDVVSELAWFTAQGTAIRSLSCAIAHSQPADGTRVVCDHETLDALIQAADAPPIPTTTTFTVASDQIAQIHFGYGHPDFTDAGFPFRSWLAANRPDVTCLAWYADDGSCEEPETIEEIREEGRMVAQYALEWAAYVEARGCTYRDGC